ncbi:MAG: hypothetical protein JW929_07025 [Anaerolineales bacterium]|nr:hypothetical protein [Anaerolineales bacterium]
MKKLIVLALISASLLAGCGPGQLFGPTFTPTPTNTLTPTLTSTPTNTSTATPTSTLSPTSTPRPVVGPLSVRGIEILLTSTVLEFNTCHFKTLVITLANGGKCLTVFGTVTPASADRAATEDFGKWLVQLDTIYKGIYIGDSPTELAWFFILPTEEKRYFINFPGSAAADLTPIL